MGYAEARADLGRPAELEALETGDLAECTDAGLYRIVGRRSRFSKLFGLRLSHDEIERWLAGRGVAAVVTGDDRRLIILTADPVPDGIDVVLAEHLGLPLANFGWLAGEVPRLPSGKPDFGAIRKRADAEQSGTETAPTQAGDSDAISAIFASVFPRAALVDTDSFSSLGGDSLSYVTFSMALEEVLGKVPDGWEAMTLAQLRSAGETAVAGGPWRWIETDIVVRAAAICGIVTLHSGPVDAAGDRLGVAGGAAVLMTLFGYNLSRFQRDRLISPERIEVLTRFLARIIFPYYLILVGYLAVKRNFDIPSLLLVSNYQGRFGSLIEPFWFLEATTQCLVFMVALFALPPVRQLARENRMGFAFALLGGAVGLKLAGAMLLDQALLQQRTFDATLVYVAIGWMAWTVTDCKSRLACYLAALGISIACWGVSDSHLVWMAVCLGLVLFVPKLPLPRLLAAPVVTIALASFYIYLSHVFVIWMMRSKFSGSLAPPVFIISLLIGVLFWWTVQRIQAWPSHPVAQKTANVWNITKTK